MYKVFLQPIKTKNTQKNYTKLSQKNRGTPKPRHIIQSDLFSEVKCF